MKTKKFLTMLAAMLLTSVCAFAQSENGEPLKGDVNGDGVVDIADVVAVLKIMKDGGGTSGEPVVYYWYIGQTDPMTMTSITNPIPTTGPETANAGAGWRTIGTELPEYNNTNRLWSDDYTIVANETLLYIALPSDKIKLRNEITQGDITSDGIIIYPEKKRLNGVDYTIWISKYPFPEFNGVLF